MPTNALAKELHQLNVLFQTAITNEVSIPVSMTSEALNAFIQFREKQAVETFKAQQEQERKASERGDNISSREAKQLLGITTTTLWRYAKEGLLHKKSVGGRTFYSRREILKLLEA